jgi:hypothetical protein
MSNGFLYFHQGWTDIFNSLALINYFKDRYTILYVLYKEDAEAVYTFYIKNLKNIVLIPCRNIDIVEKEACNYFIHNKNEYGIIDFHIIGVYDTLRIDTYKNAFHNCKSIEGIEFDRKFYVAYDIPISTRITHFEIERDVGAEERLYSKLIQNKPYILTHKTNENSFELNKKDGYEYYELNQLTNTFFDAIKILEGASELHLIDSSWAALCYHIDAKYGLFSKIPITVYCLRKFNKMFTWPTTLPNWTIIEY